MSIHEEMQAMGDRAVAAAHELAGLTTRKKNAILEAMAEALDQRRTDIAAANMQDLEAGRMAGLSAALLDRLELTDARIDAMIKGLRDVAVLKDPVGTRIARWMRPNGLEIQKVRVPIGVIAIIYESRPNVTADATGLCFKTSNAVILRGGRESIHSNKMIAEILQSGGEIKGLPPHSIQLVETTDREAVRELVQMVGRVDLAIPRGGEGLINAVTEMARVPVIKHYKGVCHTYVDAEADVEMALRIAENAKCQRPGVCNAMETLLVHEAIAPTFLPQLAARLQAVGVELRGDEATRALVPDIGVAMEADWEAEYLDLILAIRVVADVDEAILHINQYGSHHSDAIVTANAAAQKSFTQRVDSATVYVNASTRFTDGAEFGMGAEIGISTDKLHARGPMGLEELTTYKYVIAGDGQIRE
jgi:glutamate-5-semialdehyde dehydrogenase